MGCCIIWREGYTIGNGPLKVETNHKVDQLSYGEVSVHLANICVLTNVEVHFPLYQLDVRIRFSSIGRWPLTDPSFALKQLLSTIHQPELCYFF